MGQLQTREQSPETRSYICPYLSPTVPHSSRLSPAAMHAPDLSELAGITETGEVYNTNSTPGPQCDPCSPEHPINRAHPTGDETISTAGWRGYLLPVFGDFNMGCHSGMRCLGLPGGSRLSWDVNLELKFSPSSNQLVKPPPAKHSYLHQQVPPMSLLPDSGVSRLWRPVCCMQSSHANARDVEYATGSSYTPESSAPN